MHDIREIRAHPEAFDAAMARRGVAPASAALLALDEARRGAITAMEQAQSRRNALSREIGAAMKRGDAAAAAGLKAEVAALASLSAADEERALEAALATLPNILDADVPQGADEAANVVLHSHGAPRDMPDARQHFELGEALGLMEFERAAKLAGSRFVVLRGALARLERALGQWMLDLHTGEHGYEEVAPPLLANEATLYGTGQLPKFREDLFAVGDKFLIPTAEVPLTNLVAGDILPEPEQPLRFTALTACFRSEAGSAGRDTRGMLRQHQFQKVELVSIARPEDSAAEHERMTRCAERVLTELGLAWRRVFLSAGDTGFGAARTYDLEVWLPGQRAWREISSCSNCGAFQSRRMAARYRPKEGKGTAFPHTLNGSGVAVGRALIAVMETQQQPDGSILIPEVLRARMGMGSIAPGAR
jgi:seryl-tRNA synthetase